MNGETSALPFELPAHEDIELASAGTVRTWKVGSKNVFVKIWKAGDVGLLVLAGKRFLFVGATPERSCELALHAISNRHRPRYALGSAVTFDVPPKHYEVSLAVKDPAALEPSLSRWGSLLGSDSLASGAAIGSLLEVPGEVMLIRREIDVGGKWFEALGGTEGERLDQQAQ